jgi:hypothetical protein
MRRWALLLIAAVLASISVPAMSAGERTPGGEAPLVLEAKILLGAVRGRVDHLAVDLNRQRLLIAELGNNSLGIVDLATRKNAALARRSERAARCGLRSLDRYCLRCECRRWGSPHFQGRRL